jgi:microcompartment protein CcmK/EutM
MRLARTIGTLTLVEPLPAVRGGVFRIIVPLSAADLDTGLAGAEPLVAWDPLGCGDGMLVAFSEGGEAAQPFHPLDRPVDAYIAAIIDRVDLARPSPSAGPSEPAPAPRSASKANRPRPKT